MRTKSKLYINSRKFENKSPITGDIVSKTDELKRKDFTAQVEKKLSNMRIMIDEVGFVTVPMSLKS